MSRPDPEPTGWGTQRRLMALASRGWSADAIQAATGIPAADLAAAIRDRRETWPSLNRRVAVAYDQLWNRQPRRASPRDRAQADAALAQARRRGWAPPMAWDDDVIDRPDGQPSAGWKPSTRTSHRTADLIEDEAFVREHGGYRQATRGQVAERLGVTLAVLAKAHGRAADREAEPG